MLRITYWHESKPNEIKCAVADLSAQPSELHIGQDNTCFISLGDSEYASRQHATITMLGDIYLIKDNHSVNGVSLNRWGEITRLSGNGMRLLNGDSFAIADYIFIFNIVTPEPPLPWTDTPKIKRSFSKEAGAELKKSITESLLKAVDTLAGRVTSRNPK